jgi:ribosome-binding protein aMBF1 (putative translation factor)
MEVDNTTMSETKLNLAAFLSNEIDKRNISLSKLAQELKVPKTCLHSWANGVALKLNEKNLEYLNRIAAYFQVSVTKLLLNTQSGDKCADIILETTFRQGFQTFKLKIEKISE